MIPILILLEFGLWCNLICSQRLVFSTEGLCSFMFRRFTMAFLTFSAPPCFLQVSDLPTSTIVSLIFILYTHGKRIHLVAGFLLCRILYFSMVYRSCMEYHFIIFPIQHTPLITIQRNQTRSRPNSSVLLSRGPVLLLLRSL